MINKDLLLSLTSSLIPLVGVAIYSASYEYIIYTYSLEMLVLAAFLYRSTSQGDGFGFFIIYWLFVLFCIGVFTLILTNLPVLDPFNSYGYHLESSPFYLQGLFMISRPEVIISLCIYIVFQLLRYKRNSNPNYYLSLTTKNNSTSKQIGKEIIGKYLALGISFLIIAIMSLIYMHVIFATIILLIVDWVMMNILLKAHGKELHQKELEQAQ